MSIPEGVPPTESMPAPLSEKLRVYRTQLIELGIASQNTFDKTLITLAGGALGVSFAFVKQFLGDIQAVDSGKLGVAWMCWVGSLTAVLFSHYASVHANRKAVAQLDADRLPKETAGGGFARLTDFLTGLGGLAFLVGLVFAGLFVLKNLGANS